MSDPKRATLIAVGAPNSAKNNVNKTVRLTVNLDESNESKYPELNYKELLKQTAKKKRVENGKTSGLDPFSDNDDDVERVARKFEQKYGGNSTYGSKRSKYDDFADIGAGYDENDSFIDNTHGYDEMIPPECDTLYGGFYINCGSLEFKTVPENQSAVSDGEPIKRNKRRISSSSSEEESSETSSESDSQDVKDPKAIVNGEIDSHKTEHRKKKNKDIDSTKAKKVQRTDSSAATSSKQTSDENVQGEAESADSRTSQSDSLTSKPAPSSETAVTSDSSRDVEAKAEVKLTGAVQEALEELEMLVQQAREDPAQGRAKNDQCLLRLDVALSKSGVTGAVRRAAWQRAAKVLNEPRTKLLQRVKDLKTDSMECDARKLLTASGVDVQQTAASAPISASENNTAQIPASASAGTNASNSLKRKEMEDSASASAGTNASNSLKRKEMEDSVDRIDASRLTAAEKETEIVDTLQRLKVLIEERKPGMMAAYNAECERVQEKRKQLQIASAAEGAPHIDKRLPKRRFPWCPRVRTLLARLAALAGDPEAAAQLLATRALKLFPAGFVRMPTLLRQADLNKEIKASDLKRPRLGSVSQSVVTSAQQFNEPIQFPSSLTVTTSVKNLDEDKEKYKSNPAALSAFPYSLNPDLVIEKPDDRKKDADRSKDDNMYIPPNSIGSITITPVPNQKEKKSNNSLLVNEKPKEPLIRVKSPAALNEMVTNKKEKDKDKHKKMDKDRETHKRIDTPLHVDTTNHNKKEPEKSPKSKEEFSKKQIESMRTAESNIPRPGLVSVHHSPTFAKPDKRPPEVKKKKDILIVSDLDPLADIPQEPVAIDDSSSDVELVEEKSADKSELRSESSEVPSKDKSDSKKVKNSVKVRSDKGVGKECSKQEETTKEDIVSLMRDISEMQHSQEPATLNCNSFGGVITSAKHESSKQSYSRPTVLGAARSDKDKFAERTSLKKMDGYSAVTG